VFLLSLLASNLLSPRLNHVGPFHLIPFLFAIIRFPSSVKRSQLRISESSISTARIRFLRDPLASSNFSPDIRHTPSSPTILLKVMKLLSGLLGLIAYFLFFDCILADSVITQPNGLVFSYSTSGTVTQTFILQTSVVTSCAPCTATATPTPAPTAVANPSVQVQTTSGGSTSKPQLRMVAVTASILGSLYLIFV
jgi:hypothetical protein